MRALHSCSTAVADDLNGKLMSESEQLKVNKTGASQLPDK
jgi:hypothetical protein